MTMLSRRRLADRRRLEILDKYIQVMGGAQRLAGLTSFVATGSSLGYGGFGGDGEFTIYSKGGNPVQRTTQITVQGSSRSWRQHLEF
jgi:hypothetical protein